MNGGAIESLAGGDVPDGATAISLVFERPMPAWGWFLVLVAASAIAWWSYRKISFGAMRGGGAMRVALACVRVASIMLIAALLCGPAARFERIRTELDRVVLLVDRSRSMSIADGTDGRTRDEEMRAELDGARTALEELGRVKDVDFAGFAGGVFTLGRADGSALPDPGAADGERTDLDGALRQSLARAAGRPLSGVVVLSDGRSAAPVSAETYRAFERDSIPVFVLPFGARERVGDAAIVGVGAPQRAFVRDRVPVEVRVDAGGLQGPIAVRLVDAETGREIARREDAGPDGGSEGERTFVLDAPAGDAGVRNWRAEIVAERRDLVAENDAREFTVEFVDRPVRVLYIEGSSRWEYRFFKNLLLREKDVDSSVMLLSADRDFAQEGNMPIARLPRTREEFAKYDLFVIGDVPSGFFSPDQLEIMRTEVGERGAGLLWIAGERATPASWEGTALADLLPFRPPLALAPRSGPSAVRPTDASARLGLLRLSDDEDGWPDAFVDAGLAWSKLRFVQSIPNARLKPTAEVLAKAEAVGASPSSSVEPTAAVTRMRFGAGETVFVATDEIWRWRYGQGERFPERFWVPIVRMLARESIAQGGDRMEIAVSPARVAPGETAVVSVRLADEESARVAPSTLPVELRAADGTVVGRIEIVRDGAEGSASIVAEKAGSFDVVLEDAALGRASARLEVVRRDDELRRGDADREALEEISRRTGGQVLGKGGLARIAELLPRRSREIDESVVRPIWDTPLAFALLLLLVAIEWAGRRWLRLV
ncbi:MAG: hypothetical protein ACKO0W_00195 [Planctomycetota bacterium]